MAGVGVGVGLGTGAGSSRFFNFGGQSALTRDGNESLSPYPDQGYLEFDENFDPQIKVISYKVADEFANFLSRGYVFEPVAFPLGVGVMIYRQDSTAVNSK